LVRGILKDEHTNYTKNEYEIWVKVSFIKQAKLTIKAPTKNNIKEPEDYIL
jgi:hypothetical protein